MKRLNLAFLLIALAIVVQAQTTRPAVSRASDRATQQQDEKNLTELTVRAQIMNEQLTQEIGNARWIRNIIRELDLTKEKNAPLYYPVQEMNGMKNLFTSIFQLMSESKVNIYKYLADYESFDDENIMTFREFLEKFNVYFEFLPAAAGRPARFVINASDIPSREVTKLYVKEAWYFDQNNSLFDVKTLAICPIADLIMETGEQLSSGMFWVKYEDISPYIKSNYIMTSSLNNAKTYTMDDFFRRRMYDGAIIQTENLMNMPLVKLFETDEEIAAEQQRIEGELAAFEKALWFQPDSAALTNASNKKTSGRTAKAPAVKKEKAPAQPKAVSASSSGSSSSGTTRSIRR